MTCCEHKKVPERFYIDPESDRSEKDAIYKIAFDKFPPLPMWYQPSISTTVKYRSDRGKFRPALHIGQRKLFIGELRYLTSVLAKWDTKISLVYAGSAPGLHIPYLSTLFPNITFYLYDPAKFGIKETSQIKIFQTYFTDKIATEHKHCDIFISDIRVGDSTRVDRKSFENQVSQDMKIQAKWVEIICPKLGSMLKFRPPYGKGAFEYLSGRIMLQCWAPHRSTESRLIVPPQTTDKLEKTTYDYGAYEDYMFYLNAIIREWAFYPHNIRAKGIDHCYDCKHEIIAWETYINFRCKGSRVPSVSVPSYITNFMINTLSKNISKHLITNELPHGHQPDTPMYLKRKQLYTKYGKIKDNKFS